MADDPEPLDVEGAVAALNDVLRCQYRSVLAYPLLAGSLVGFEHQSLKLELLHMADEEAQDLRRLVEKIITLEGTPTTEVAPFSCDPDPRAAAQSVIEWDTETIEKMKAVIPHTGQEGRSEALEHRMEHMIMRKQEQVDALLRASRRP